MSDTPGDEQTNHRPLDPRIREENGRWDYHCSQCHRVVFYGSDGEWHHEMRRKRRGARKP